MSSFRFRKRKFIIVYSIALAIMVFIGAIIINATNYVNSIAAVGVLGGCLLGIYCYTHFMISRGFFDISMIFACILFLFCFGQFFMYGLGIQYDYFFTNNYYRLFFNNDDFYVLYGEVISILAIGFFMLATLFSLKEHVKNKKSNSITHKSLKYVCLILFFVSFPIMAIYKFYVLGYSFVNGYAATGGLIQPGIVRFLGVFFIPASIGLLACNVSSKKNYRLLSMLLVLYSLIGLAIGGRTEPLIITTSIILLTLYNKKLKQGAILFFLIAMYCVATILVTVSEVRTIDDKQILDAIGLFFKNLITLRTITYLICEMGFSGSSMVWTVYLVKTGQQPLYGGMTYVGAIMNMIPSSLDVFGILSGLDKYCHLEGFLTETLGFNFGVGFNLIAEAYLNFGFVSVIFIFFYGILLNSIFNAYKKNGTWNLYKSIVMFSVLMTLPRRASLYFADQWMLCIIIIWLLCKIAQYNSKSRRGLINAKVAY